MIAFVGHNSYETWLPIAVLAADQSEHSVCVVRLDGPWYGEAAIIGHSNTTESQDVGIDVLMRGLKTGRLDSGLIHDAMFSFMEGKLDILLGSRQSLERYTTQDISRILSELNAVYDLLICDLGESKEAMVGKILDDAQAVIVSVDQIRWNIQHMIDRFGTYGEKNIYVLNRYVPDSIYNRRNLSRLFPELKKLVLVPTCPAYLDAISNHNVIDFFLQRVSIENDREKDDENGIVESAMTLYIAIRQVINMRREES